MKIAVAVIVLLLVLAGADSMFVVREGHAALLFQFGGIQRSGISPGLHFKIPLVQQVSVYDTRAIVLESEPEAYQTADGGAVQIGFYVRWHVVDADRYFRATSGEPLQATQQLTPLIRDALRSEVKAHSLDDLVDGAQTSAIDAQLRTLADAETRKQIGISVLDAGIERIELPDAATDAVYKRMRADAKGTATALRAAGDEKAAGISTDGQREIQQLLAQAQRDADTTRGEGDAQAAKIYADSYSQDPQFFAFWRSLQAYRKAFGNGHTVIVLDPDSPFLKEFGGAATAPAKTH